MSAVEKIIDLLENELSDGELVEVWNDYCERSNRCDDEIFPLEYFDEYYENYTPSEIAQVLFNSTNFNPNDKWFSFDGYGNPRTFNYLEEEMDLEAIADFAVEHDYSFGIWEIADILEEYDG